MSTKNWNLIQNFLINAMEQNIAEDNGLAEQAVAEMAAHASEKIASQLTKNKD